VDSLNIEEMARKFVSGLPAALSSMRAELESNFRAALQGAAQRYDLATRSEFDVQAKVLERSRQRITELEARLAALEDRLEKLQASAPPAA
jgi:BMFP domain-containing protein YqiC